MKKLSVMAIPMMALIAALGACDKTSTIGSSIVQDRIGVVVDSSFTVTGYSIPIEKVQSRTVSQLLGEINAPGYGRLSSDVVMQFMPSAQLDSNLVSAADIDSMVMYMYMSAGEYVGDSIAPMGLNVYRLTQNLPSPIYSDFNPDGYYNPSAPLAKKIYNISNESLKLAGDTVFDGGVEISMKMPQDLAVELYDAYKKNPNDYLSPTSFIDNVFKGVYVKNSFGSGRLIRTSSTMMTFYYHYYDAEEDSTYYKSGNYFAVTPEVINNNDIAFEISPQLQARIDEGQQIIAAPVGMELKVRFPAPEVIASYKASQANISVLNSVSFTVPASEVTNDFGFTVPTYILLVLSKDRDTFFAKNQLPDNETSFYATYDSTTGTYSFGDMRAYFIDLLSKDTITEEDYTFNIVPVSATFETSSSSSYYSYYYGTTSTLATLIPYMASPVMARLYLEDAKVKLTYSTQTVD